MSTTTSITFSYVTKGKNMLTNTHRNACANSSVGGKSMYIQTLSQRHCMLAQIWLGKLSVISLPQV